MGRLKAVVVGAGPAGGVLASFLIRGGHQVVLVDAAPGLPQALRERGLKVSGAAEVHVGVWRVYATLRSVIGWEPDLIVVATKANVVPALCPHLEGAAGPGTFFLSHQNGIDTEEPLVATFGADRVLRSVVRYGAVVVEPGHLRMTFWSPPNYLGGLGPAASSVAGRLAALLTDAGLPTEAVPDIGAKVWEKAIANALNSVCGLTGLTIGGVLDVPELKATFVALLEERIAIARALGLALPDDLLARLVAFHETAREHRPSSSVEVEQGLPTEAEWIEGKFVEHGRRLGVPAPIDQTILALVRGRRVAADQARAAAEAADRLRRATA